MTIIEDRARIATLVAQEPDRLRGYRVDAIDGEAGHVAGAVAQTSVDGQHLAVTIPRLGGLRHTDVSIELDAVRCIDLTDKHIEVDRIVEWVHASPGVDD